MFGRKTSFIVSLAISLISLAVSAKMSVANGREANRCPLRQFGQFSEWSEPINLGPEIWRAVNVMGTPVWVLVGSVEI